MNTLKNGKFIPLKQDKHHNRDLFYYYLETSYIQEVRALDPEEEEKNKNLIILFMDNYKF